MVTPGSSLTTIGSLNLLLVLVLVHDVMVMFMCVVFFVYFVMEDCGPGIGGGCDTFQCSNL
jgi:hypothetical protein